MTIRPTLIPDAGPMLDRLYDRLPDHYRTADSTADFPLYRWLAGICRIQNDVEVLQERVDYVAPSDGGTPGDTSDLTDPTTADVSWLSWLAQLVGVRLTSNLSEEEMREAVQFASSGWRAGSKASVADAAKSELTGTRYARVYDHSITEPGDGGEWDVLIVTRASETPDPELVLAAVERRGAKPAGVILHHRAYEASWGTLEAERPTWAQWNGVTWQQIEETGL